MAIWVIDPTAFVNLLPQSATMKFNTALLFATTALYIICTQNNARPTNWVKVLPYVVIGIAGITLIADILSIDLFLDEFIVADPLTSSNAFPGRMSEMTAALFLLIGFALLLSEDHSYISETLVITCNLTSLLAIFAFLFDFESLYAIDFFSTVSFFTGFLFLLLSLVIVLILPQGVIRAFIIADTPSGIASRQLLPMALLIPSVLGWLVLQGVNQDLYQPTFALVLMMILTVTLQMGMVILHAFTLRHWYQKNELMQKQLLDREIGRMELETILEVNKTKEEFFAQLSHDMRSPLTVIILSSDIVIQYQEKLTRERQVKHLRKIKYQASSMLDFIDDLMLLSQFELDDLSSNIASADIVEFCKTYYAEFIEYNEPKFHDFILIAPSSSIYIDFDKKLLRRLLNNLIGNAIKYSPDGGQIALQVQIVDDRLQLSVQDEGIGIPKDNIESLYDVFQRADNVGSIKGYGLGLTIVKKVADKHNATLEIDSIVGQGSTFTVTFLNSFEYSQS